MPEIFTIKSYKNQTRLNENGIEAHIRPVLEVDLERAATLFISQYIDELEMFAPVRYVNILFIHDLFLLYFITNPNL